MYIVGIDIAKRKHEAAVIDGEGAVIIKPFSLHQQLLRVQSAAGHAHCCQAAA